MIPKICFAGKHSSSCRDGKYTQSNWPRKGGQSYAYQGEASFSRRQTMTATIYDL